MGTTGPATPSVLDPATMCACASRARLVSAERTLSSAETVLPEWMRNVRWDEL